MSATTDRSLLSVRVRKRTVVAPEIVHLELESADGALLPAWEAGAHVDVLLPSGQVRQYSLCSDPHDRRLYAICVRREAAGRGGSQLIVDDVREGTELSLSKPRNHFRLEKSSSIVLVAGGIGITPLVAMVAEADARGTDWHLYYGGRDLQHMPFVDELAQYGDARVTVVPQDERGPLDVVAIVASVAEDAQLYCCGPATLLEAVQRASATAGIIDRLHVERFQAPLDRAATVTARDSAFELELRESGLTPQVPADRSILEMVQAVRPNIAFSCTEGYCGSCETVVLEGQRDHRGTLMSAEEHDQEGTMLICVGRSRTGRLVLEL